MCFTITMVGHYLIFDDRCPLCLAAARKVRRHDGARRVSLQPLSRLALPQSIRIPPARELTTALHLVAPDGAVYKGADALAYMAILLPRYRLLGRVLLLPVVRPAARILYRLIARNRVWISRAVGHKLGHGQGKIQIPRSTPPAR
ncbi:MAG: DUF393 domain-containing protein [candidate division Zixibacteria bacterium]|nr:DUF393 domain-containing protein [candidate division Zixibacteria bacterium]